MAVGAAFAAALIGLPNAPVAGADPTEAVGDPFEDLHGTGTDLTIGGQPWTVALDNLENSNPLTAGFATATDQIVDGYNSIDADPFSDLVGAIDPHAFGANGLATDLFGEVATTLDYGFRDLPAIFGPSFDWVVTDSNNFGLMLDPIIESLFGVTP